MRRIRVPSPLSVQAETAVLAPASSIAAEWRHGILLDRGPQLSSIKLKPLSVVQLHHDDPRIVRIDHDRLGLAFV